MADVAKHLNNPVADIRFPTATNDILGQGKYQVIPVLPALIKGTKF